jgi:hypothetical protein
MVCCASRLESCGVRPRRIPALTKGFVSELFYGHTGQIMVAPFAAEGDAFRAEQPRPWSDGRYVQLGGQYRMFDLHPDGERFVLTAQTQTGAKQDHLTFIFNFFDELRRIAPATKR